MGWAIGVYQRSPASRGLAMVVARVDTRPSRWLIVHRASGSGGGPRRVEISYVYGQNSTWKSGRKESFRAHAHFLLRIAPLTIVTSKADPAGDARTRESLHSLRPAGRPHRDAVPTDQVCAHIIPRSGFCTKLKPPG